MKQHSLSSIQAKLLKLLSKNPENPLSYRDLAREVDVSSTNTIAYHLKQLERKGHLKRDPINPRNYFTLDHAEKGVLYLNLFGLAHCGPRGSILDGNPADRIPISSRLVPFPADHAFLVKAKGDSMEPRIFNGDIVLVKRQATADSGEVVVCINNEEALIKRFVRQGKNVSLISWNRKYSPFPPADDFRIQGVVKNIVSGNIFSQEI